MMSTAIDAPTPPDNGTSSEPDQRKGADDRYLSESVVGDVVPSEPVDDLDQPPRQRRQLVVSELPLPAIGEGLDQIERQVRIKQCWQDRPDNKVQCEEHDKGELRPMLNRRDKCPNGRGGACGSDANCRAVWLGIG